MRVLAAVAALLLGACLVLLTPACDVDEMLREAGSVQFHGTVKTAHGIPVAGVAVYLNHGCSNGTTEQAETDLTGHYNTGEVHVGTFCCGGVSLSFYKGGERRDVYVGKCGTRKVKISDWPEEG